MGVVRDLTRQVVHPTPVTRELMIQMCVLAFALGMVMAGAVEASRVDDGSWGFIFGMLLGGLLVTYVRTARLWYQFLD